MNKNKIITSVILVLIGGLIGYGINDKPQIIFENVQDQKSEVVEDNAPLDLTNLWKVYNILQTDYFDATVFNSQKQINGAIKGLVESVGDPYTVYMSSEENSAFKTSLAGEFEGIGAELSIRQGALIVISPLKDSPAEKAGLKSGDIIYKIGDEFAGDMNLLEAIMKIRGPQGTYVNLTILRETEAEPVELSIKRDTITIPDVDYKELEGDIFHISIYQFGDNTSLEFQNIIQKLLLENPKGIILDLRGDGGGYLESAVDVLSEFVLGEKEAVKIKYKDENKNYSLYTKNKGRLKDIPLVVLIDSGSASASEIVAGAIQDWGRGIIIGEKSFGKGSVQELDDLENGASLRVTIAKWFTPNDRTIQDVGIMPDQIVEFTKEGYEEGMDSQLQAALEALKIGNGK
ncbi:hypothetical protein A2335_04715 [Candidatus Peregrinibacteria bacterium RIFOXYB2_FULL_32_7]|nr:MAG: hypothetical protein A2335_04715 [Candidatus Peregrinibacteria bacterium RIFOXYB2_FULL_32_7]